MYLLVPHFETINYLAAINYTWHAFVDPKDPDNEYIKSITILKGQYNLFNEDFHVEHHIRPGLHWSKSEDEYRKRFSDYVENAATVFEDTQEFELFTWILIGDWDELAKHFVDLSGKLSHEGKIKLLKYRAGAVPRAGPADKSD